MYKVMVYDVTDEQLYNIARSSGYKCKVAV